MSLPRSESLLIRCYRRLTYLYPAGFRDEYQSELLELVRERQQGLKDVPGVVSLWTEMIADVLTTAPKEHWNMLKQDLRHAIRLLGKTPSTAISAALVLAIGIGATTAVFSIVNAVLLRPLPFASPERLVFIQEASVSQGIDSMGPAFPNLLDYTAQARQFESIGAWNNGGFTLTGHGEAERLDGAWISASLFPTLGVQPAIGRNFLPEEDQPNVETAVLLGYGLWQRRFAGDPSIVGRNINVNGSSRTVVGIMPAGFRFPESADIWGPLSLDPKGNRRTDHFLTAIGRIRPGISIPQAHAGLAAVLKGIQSSHPDETSELSILTTPVRERFTGEYRPALLRLLGAVGLVLAIACTNTMNLLLARAAGRTREIAIRTALGAHRRRLIRQLMTESILLGVMGGALGLALGQTTLKLLIRFSPVDIPYWVDLHTDWRVLGFCAAVTLGSVLLFGIVPALKTSGTSPAGALSETRRGVTAALGSSRLRQGIVLAQMALSVILLVGSGLMIRSFLKLQDFDLGFQPRDVLTFRISLPRTRYKEASDRDAFYKRMRAQLAVIPGVRHVATATGLPVAGNWYRTLQKANETKTRPGDLPSVHHIIVSPEYFVSMGIPLKRGRAFTDADGKAAPVVVVSETLARQQWPGRNAVGQRIRIDPFLPGQPWRTVVGIVGDVRSEGARKDPAAAVYVPESFDAVSSVSAVLKTGLPPANLMQAARQAMHRLDPGLPLYGARPVLAVIAEATWQFRFFTFLLSAFAGVAVLLASVGLSGIMASMVVERTHEIGIRMAIGATANQAVRLMLSHALWIAGAGAAVGILAALAMTRALAGQLFEVGPYDGLTFGAVVLVLLCASFVAAWLPARRASQVDPACALRWE